ncbi:sigma 54-interacting transcriptional regulator [Peribacillus castrilensis]|uniref:sigma-54-dependent Fis family transcriptional regulator n=1 Tax=Peribacillus castrilensis TaxID=2897690 RepID=UPI0007BEB789
MKNPYISLDIFSSPKTEKDRIERAWENFISGQNLVSEVRSLTYQSWERSIRHGVHPTKGRAPLVLSQDEIQEYQTTHTFFSISESLLPKLKESAIDSGHLIVICNHKGELLYLDGDASLKKKAENINFAAGTSWSESYVGTNAMGTSLATGVPMQVFAGEHFCQPVHNWVCSASPIKDPATQKVLGAVNLTGIWDVVHPLSLSAVVSITQTIEEKLQSQLKFEHFLLLEHYIETTRKSPSKIVAVLDHGHQVIKASTPWYDKGWIDYNNRLINSLSVCSGTEGMKDGWIFESAPLYHQGFPIGFMIHAISKVKPLNKTGFSTKYSFTNMIGKSPEFQSVIDEAHTMANLDLPVLIEGESGTGKELFAQSIHAYSHRSEAAFVAVNCGAIPKELAASELFGYEEGTFTGSIKGGRAGKFQQAEGGTIFLDEVGEMPLDLQAMFLRVLEEGEIVRMGGREPIKLNVRVIAATNCNLKKACEEGTFRKDLYYRLNILSLEVPPLRERTGDVPLLLNHFLTKTCAEIRRPPLKIGDQDMFVLEQYGWPGNVRELRNFAYKVAIKANGNIITNSDFPKEIGLTNRIINYSATDHTHQKLNNKEHPLILTNPSSSHEESVSYPTSLKQQELHMILMVLNEANGNVTAAAKKLGIHRSTIYRKLGRNTKNEGLSNNNG